MRGLGKSKKKLGSSGRTRTILPIQPLARIHNDFAINTGKTKRWKKPSTLNRNRLKSRQSREWVDRRYKSSTDLEFMRSERTGLLERFPFHSNLCRDTKKEGRNLQKTRVTDDSFWRCKERSGTVIEPVSNPRPLPCNPCPTNSIGNSRVSPSSLLTTQFHRRVYCPLGDS